MELKHGNTATNDNGINDEKLGGDDDGENKTKRKK